MKQEAEPGKQHVELEGNIARAAAKEVEYGMNHPFVNEGTVNTYIYPFISRLETNLDLMINFERRESEKR